MTEFDPLAPLPGAPDPWTASSMPAWRDRPPYAMTEMIDAEPALAERLVGRLAIDPALAALVEALSTAARTRQPIITTGCGTSEHAAMVVAALLSDALGDAAVTPVQALELARRAPATGVVLGISHEGGTWATNLALAAGRDAGALTALITVSDRSPGALAADVVLTTGEQDQSWCHTVGYLSPILAGAVVAGVLRDAPLEAEWARNLLDRVTAGSAAAAATTVQRLASCSRLLVVGSGVDHAAAREVALKVEEGARLPATAHQLETIRHGHLAAADELTGLVLVLTDGEAWGAPLLERALAVLRSAELLGMAAAALVADDIAGQLPAELTSAGRLVVRIGSARTRLAAAAIGSTVPLQLLAERLARVRGRNPDTIGREDPRQAAAADA